MMRAIRVQWQGAAWFDWGLTETLKAQNQIRVASSSYTVSDVYPVGSRIKVVSNNATVYGTVTTLSTSSSAVIVDIAPDSGTVTSTVTSVAASIIDPAGLPLPDSVTTNNPNLMINPNFQVAQLGVSFTAATTPLNSDDTYLFDQWILLSDGNDAVDVTQETSVVPAGSGTAIKLEVETANKKFGLLQPLENLDTVNLDGSILSLSFMARNAASDDKTDVVKAVVLAWSSTADAITSDVVSAWNADLTIPTFATNWTAENTPASLTLTQVYQTFTIENINLDTASTANLALFIWCDNADGAIDDAVYISNIKLEESVTATEYTAPLIEDDLHKAQRFLCKSFNQSVTPGTAATVGSPYFAWTASTVQKACPIVFPITMLSTPSVVAYAPSDGSSGNIDSALTPRTAIIVRPGQNGVSVGTNDANSAQSITFHYVATSQL
tara:strand:+ start:340 stop:1656 length:1317 start_codon:yes stop_codon:yes gene_type:complete